VIIETELIGWDGDGRRLRRKRIVLEIEDHLIFGDRFRVAVVRAANESEPERWWNLFRVLRVTLDGDLDCVR